jgi:hypothetical protein
LRQISNANPANSTVGFVIVSGANGAMIVVDRAPWHHLSTNWTCYNVPFTTAGNWSSVQQPVGSSSSSFNNNTTMMAATTAEIDAVLGSITDVQILGEYQTGADVGQLDNVVLDCLASSS